MWLRKHENGREKRANSVLIGTNEADIRSRAKSMTSPSKQGILKRPMSIDIHVLEERCGICLDKASQPKIMPCQHTFCLSCLQTHVIAKHDPKNESLTLEQLKTALNAEILELKCPTCKTMCVLENGFDGLEALPSYAVPAFLSGLGSPTWENFARRSSFSNRCFKCQTVLVYDVRCQHCELNFCQVCWIEHADEISSKVKDFAKQLSDCEDRLQYKHQDFQTQCQMLEEIVKSGANERINQIREMESKVLDQIKNLSAEGTQFKQVFKDRIDLLTEQIDNHSEKNIVDHSEKVTTYVNLHTEVSKILEDISQFGETRKTFDVDTFTLEDSHDAQTNDINVVQYVGSVDPQDAVLNQYKKRNFTPKLIWRKCPKSAGIGIPPWAPELVYVAATDSKVVLVLNKTTNKIVSQLKHANMLCPYSVAFCFIAREIFVSDKWNHCIHVFSHDGVYSRKLCSRGSDEGQLLSPQGIAITDSRQILVCDTGNNRVAILDCDTGEHAGFLGRSGVKNEFKMPTDVKVAGDKIYISDAGNYRIKVYNKQGDKVMEFGGLGKNLGQFRSAEVVAVDAYGFILVGDSGNSRLQIFDSNAELVRIYGKNNRFQWISGIHITQDLDIIVTDSKNKCLFIF